MGHFSTDSKQFADVVQAMRNAQKAYFKSRKQTDLIAAKRLEASVDMRVAAILGESKEDEADESPRPHCDE